MNTLSLAGSLIASILLILSSVFGLYKDWREQQMRYYVFFSLSSFIILFTMFLTYAFPDSPNLTRINRVTQLGTVLSFSSIFVLSMVFPKGEKKFPFKYTAVIMMPALIIAYIVTCTDYTITRAYFKDGALVREFRGLYRVYAIITFIYLILAIGNFIRKYIKTKVEIYRLQMRYVFVGTAIAMLLSAVMSIILPFGFQYSELYVLGPAVSVFIGVSALFYAIISYNIMDLTTAVHKTVTYIVITTVIFVPIFLLIMARDRGFLHLEQMPLYLVAVSIVVIFLLFSVYVQPIIDRAFKRKQYEFEGIIDNFIRDVERQKDFQGIIQKSVDVLHDSLFLKRVFFLLLNNESKRYESYYQNGEKFNFEPLERNSSVIRWFVRNQQILHMDRVYTDTSEFEEIKDEFINFFNTNKAKLILPVYHERRVLGLLCLGDKDSLAAYKPDEILKLKFFLSEFNVHLSNALLYEESKKQQLISRSMELSSNILARSSPAVLPNLLGIKFGAFIIPRYGEGIDYFDFIRPVSHGIGIIATDIAGVGIDSALYSVVLRSAFQSCIQEAPSAYSVIQRLNNALYEYSEGKGGLVTAYYTYYDLRLMRLIYCNAGFPPLELYRIEKNDFDSLDTEGIPLGYDPKSNYGMGRTNLLRGDIGAIYSKALITSKNQKKEAFGLGNLRSVIKEHRSERPGEIVNAIKERFTSFLGLQPPESDIVVILFKIV